MKFELIDFPYFADSRGETIPFELDSSFPITVKRVYLVTGKENAVRGGHAHKTEEEVFVASSGTVTAVVNDGSGDQEIRLDKKNKGLLIRKDCWHEFKNFSPDCVLLCFSSTHFAGRDDYVETKEEFLK
ncbi:FdtA/QdtA family cupin domain-containing protein [Candidatus Gracilibacteria bacterium]|nr:FdtA/QdtA family cupin domain-containing protein [Candidatus Gracilibacteria bacterium]